MVSGSSRAAQRAQNRISPQWPTGSQQQQVHLDLHVDDIEEGRPASCCSRRQNSSVCARDPADNPAGDEAWARLVSRVFQNRHIHRDWSKELAQVPGTGADVTACCYTACAPAAAAAAAPNNSNAPANPAATKPTENSPPRRRRSSNRGRLHLSWVSWTVERKHWCTAVNVARSWQQQSRAAIRRDNRSGRSLVR